MESYGATVLRIFLGVIYVMHAYLAAFVYGPHGMAAFQRAQGLPFPEVGTWYVILAHGLGGICLILGLLVRWAALVNIPIMAWLFVPFAYLGEAAAGWAFLVWLFGGGLGLALVVFIVLKLLGR